MRWRTLWGRGRLGLLAYGAGAKGCVPLCGRATVAVGFADCPALLGATEARPHRGTQPLALDTFVVHQGDVQRTVGIAHRCPAPR